MSLLTSKGDRARLAKFSGVSRRGSSLASVLVLMVLISLVGFAVAALSSSQLAVSGQRNKSSVARALAEASLTSACGRILHSTPYGTHHERIEKHFEGTPADSVGLLTFDPAQAASLGIPFSVNNLSGTTSVPGWGGASVPLEQVHLMGVGRHAGVERRVEAVLYLPRFPYVLSSSGPLRSNGGLEVLGVRHGDALAGGFEAIDEKDQVAGHLVSNGTDSGLTKAVTLAGDSSIKGDVQSSGSVDLSPQVQVGGEVRAHSDPVGLPTLDLAQFDPYQESGLTTLTTESLAQLPVEGYARRAGNLNISGPLELNGGVLFVDGDLTVTGGIHGKGAVIVTGKTHMSGGGTLGTDNQAALLSKGDIVLEGSAAQRANFQGLVYTEGDFTTRYVNVAGAFVAHKPENDGGSQVQMDNSKVVHVPTSTAISFAVTTTTTSTTPGQPWSIPIHFDTAWDPNVDWMRPPDGESAGTVIGHPSPLPGQPGGSAVGGSQISSSSAGATGATAVAGGGVPDPTGGPFYGNDVFAPPGATFADSGEIAFDASKVTLPPNFNNSLMAQSPELAWGMVTATLTSGTYQGQAFLDYVKNQMNNDAAFDAWKASYENRIISLAVRAASEQTPSSSIGGTTAPTSQTFSSSKAWSIDLSKFLKESDRLRVLMWRDR